MLLSMKPQLYKDISLINGMYSFSQLECEGGAISKIFVMTWIWNLIFKGHYFIKIDFAQRALAIFGEII